MRYQQSAVSGQQKMEKSKEHLAGHYAWQGSYYVIQHRLSLLSADCIPGGVHPTFVGIGSNSCCAQHSLRAES
jgi:hypothetical protein